MTNGGDIFGLIVVYYSVGLVICAWCDAICGTDTGLWCFGEAFFWPVLVICMIVELAMGGFRHLLVHIGVIFGRKRGEKGDLL